MAAAIRHFNIGLLLLAGLKGDEFELLPLGPDHLMGSANRQEEIPAQTL
jgi:hypothetical protein